jgi:shikimate 5-dehydrogenase
MELTILNRTEEVAHELAERLTAYFEREVAVAGGRARILDAIPRQDVVVATLTIPAEYSALGTGLDQPVSDQSVGENLAASAEVLIRGKPTLIVSDIRYPGDEFATIRQARELGFATLDGKPMVVNQAIEAFWWLYGDELSSQGRRKKDVAVIMREAAGMA